MQGDPKSEISSFLTTLNNLPTSAEPAAGAHARAPSAPPLLHVRLRA
jgi:hypothetical protein